MRQVVIGIDKNGKPYVASCPSKIQVIIKEDKRRSARKVWRTLVYRLKFALRA